MNDNLKLIAKGVTKEQIERLDRTKIEVPVH